MGSAVTSKGQVTIPKRLRDELGIRPGTLVDFESDGRGGARLVKTKIQPISDQPVGGTGRLPDDLPAEGGFARFLGIGLNPDGLTTDEYMATIRDPVRELDRS